jgi:Adenylate and Guanylate cyclase catalytic domain
MARKSAAALSVVAGTIDGRPQPPDDLSVFQKDVWRRTVASEAASFFKTAAFWPAAFARIHKLRLATMQGKTGCSSQVPSRAHDACCIFRHARARAARGAPQRARRAGFLTRIIGVPGDSAECSSSRARCSDVIGRYEGHVAKFMGDGVLAYFGYPRAHEDDAERAVRAGLELTAVVRQLPGEGGRASAVRVGIATGQVVVGDLIGVGAAQEEAVVGETPNLAARLQGLAEPGGVVIAKPPGAWSVVCSSSPIWAAGS